MGTGQPLLEVDGVTLRYKTPDHLVTATYRVSFKVWPGDRFVLLGPSGCGKSTLLKAVGGYMAPTEGEIRLKGRPVTEPGSDRMMVFQEFDQLLPWKTVRQNVVFALAANRVGEERGFPFLGRSSIAGPNGELLARADDRPGIIYADIDPARARQKRQVRVPGQHEIDRIADRRPEFYASIIEPQARA